MPHSKQAWIFSASQKDKEATRQHMAQTPNEHIPIQQGWSVSAAKASQENGHSAFSFS